MGNATHWLIFLGILGLLSVVLVITLTAIFFGIIFLVNNARVNRPHGRIKESEAETNPPDETMRFTWIAILLAGPVLGLAIGAASSFLGIPLLRGIPRLIPALVGGVGGGALSLLIAGLLSLARRSAHHS